MVIIAAFAFAIYHPGYILDNPIREDREAKYTAISSVEEIAL